MDVAGRATVQPGPGVCSEAEVRALVENFYARVRQDPQLGPVFAAHVHDWPAHIDLLCDFWSALLRGTRRFAGSPMRKHAQIDGLDQALFQRWLALFAQTTATLGNPAMQQLADVSAARIGATLWRGYQQSRWPALPPILGQPARD